MRTAVVTFTLLLVGYASFALEFRNTSWLMSKEQVIASEKERVVSELNLSGQQQIVFRTIVYGFSATLTYLLENDKLLCASYNFRKDPTGKIFSRLSQELTTQYGEPVFEREDLAGWRLEKTEIALAHLPDGTCYAAYWEKTYFARLNSAAARGIEKTLLE